MANDDAVSVRFREKLKDARLAKGWTQAQLAAELTSRGVPAGWSVIAKIEAGSRGVQIGEAAAIADAFGTSVDQLLGRRARPAADRAFLLRQLHQSLADAARSVRVAVRDLAQATDELADEADGNNTIAALVVAAQQACTAGDDWERQLATVGGQLSETRALATTRKKGKGNDNA